MDGLTSLTSTTTFDGVDTYVTVYPSYYLGDIIFFLGIIIFFQALCACGILFNTFSRKSK